MKLYYPVRPYSLNQRFGDDAACVDTTQNVPRNDRKVIGTATPGICPVGYVSLYKDLGLKGHSGCDLYAVHGQEVYHCGPDGFVEEVQDNPVLGLGLGIVTKEKFDYENGFYQMKIRYWHLMDFCVSKGDFVKTGQLIGHSDNTGYSAGDHLHLEVKPVEFKVRLNAYQNIFQNNGYNGAIDPGQFFCGEYADTVLETNHVFSKRLSYGDSSDEVVYLQKALKNLGYFPKEQECTGYYGKITADAVYQFQSSENILSMWEKMYLRFSYSTFGPKSIKRLNDLLAS